MIAKLVKGENLTAAQVKQVKAAFVHRFTGEHVPAWAKQPRPDGTAYEPMYATDADWIADKAFYVHKDGQIASTPHHCEPVSMAE